MGEAACIFYQFLVNFVNFCSNQFLVNFINFCRKPKHLALVLVAFNIALLICSHIDKFLAHVLTKVDCSCLQGLAKGWRARF